MRKCGKLMYSGQDTDDNMAHDIECWVTKASTAHTGFVILTAFPLQNWLHERASTVRYTYIACLMCPEIQTISIP
jgi:hypothetical protein